MKTNKKTVDVWVSKDGIDGLTVECNGPSWIKGTLTYDEVEEATIELTPTKLKEAMQVDGFSESAIKEVRSRLFPDEEF